MTSENEDYDIFSYIYQYQRLESLRKDDTAGLQTELLCNKLGSKYPDFQKHIIKLCKQYMNLCEQYNVYRMIILNSNNKTCAIMNYWLNYDVRELNNDTILNSDFYNDLTELIKQNSNISDYSVNLHPIKKEEFNKLKILHELYSNFYKMNGKIMTSLTRNGCKKYCEHKKNCIQLYNNNIDSCTTNRTSKFCIELQNFSNNYAPDETCETCSEVLSLKPFPPQFQETNVLPSQTERVIHSTVESQNGTPHFTNSKEYIIIPTTICIILGILFFLLILYKFTPFGSRLYSHLLKKKVIGYKFEKEADELLNITNEDDNVGYRRDQNSIHYHMQNF
ncbi:PIR Superfamily Protein [Plasmodium ovale wallikeri]|uniref:PIR Superfamily Protein n=1 Tax=Plasmodium ovale wallikeri TaxID=864142 RepID=A0A1A9AH39_PLAOA|nr:PIR Superfamily Protein [Plasmodium ovale wallikeri]SBT55554.1 PIR Superfamily Protein [Plasmodium ovale wallikeri]